MQSTVQLGSAQLHDRDQYTCTASFTRLSIRSRCSEEYRHFAFVKVVQKGPVVRILRPFYIGRSYHLTDTERT